MNILTKICIVLLVILVLVACPLFIRMATVTPNYKEAYRRQVEMTEVHKQQAQKLAIEINKANDERNAAVQDAEQARNQRLAEVKAVRDDLNASRLQLTSQETKLQKMEAALSKFEITLRETNAQLLLTLQQRDAAYKETTELKETNRNVSDQLLTARANIERWKKLEEVLREKIVDLEDRLASVGEAPVRGATAEEPEKTVKIEGEVNGTITAIKLDPGVASINVGSAQGVIKGAKLIIYRRDQFIGYLKIVEVEPHRAAGIILDTLLDPQQGDKVTSRLE